MVIDNMEPRSLFGSVGSAEHSTTRSRCTFIGCVINLLF